MSKKLTPKGFEIAANTHLEGTNLLALVTGIRLDTNEEGFIKEHVFQNLETALRSAIKMAPEDIVKTKCQNLLNFMESY